MCEVIHLKVSKTQVSRLLLLFLNSWSHPAFISRALKSWSHAPEKVSPVIEIFLAGRVNPVIFGTYFIQDSRDPQVFLSQWCDSYAQTWIVFMRFQVAKLGAIDQSWTSGEESRIWYRLLLRLGFFQLFLLKFLKPTWGSDMVRTLNFEFFFCTRNSKKVDAIYIFDRAERGLLTPKVRKYHCL